MKPRIDAVSFGAITVGGTAIKHDVIISLNGEVRKRRKKLSKAVYGTSHTVSLAEAEATYENGAQLLVVGCGHFDRLRLSSEAQAFLAEKGCIVQLRPTRKAVRLWNETEGRAVGLFHITC